jgi:iron(II)-dependent oxidoreductase
MFSGKMTMGSAVLDDHNPLMEVFVDFFYIDKFEVTNTKYKAFIDAGGYGEPKYWDEEGFKLVSDFTDRTGKPGPATWEQGTFPLGKEEFPVTGVSWYEALAYARWAGKRLPTEEEWEKAASYNPGTASKTIYPWGDKWNADSGNFQEDEVTKTGSFPEDLSPIGCYDMGGNAFEWSSSSYKDKYRVIRGGSVSLSESTLKRFARNTKRKCPKPSYRSKNTGFRCAATPNIPGDK